MTAQTPDLIEELRALLRHACDRGLLTGSRPEETLRIKEAIVDPLVDAMQAYRGAPDDQAETG